MRFSVPIFAALLVFTSCAGEEPDPNAEPTVPALDSRDLDRTVLTAEDVGEGWIAETEPSPNTVQIGGRIGAANVAPTVARATSEFAEKDDTGAISDSLFLLRRESDARAVITSHDGAAETKSWTQEREDGGSSSFALTGIVPGSQNLGDQAFTASIDVEITEASTGRKTQRKVEYVAFRIDSLVAFIVAQDTAVTPLAHTLESRAEDALTSSTPVP